MNRAFAGTVLAALAMGFLLLLGTLAMGLTAFAVTAAVPMVLGAPLPVMLATGSTFALAAMALLAMSVTGR